MKYLRAHFPSLHQSSLFIIKPCHHRPKALIPSGVFREVLSVTCEMYILCSAFSDCSSSPLFSSVQYRPLPSCLCVLKHSIIMRFCVTCICVHCANVAIMFFSLVLSCVSHFICGCVLNYFYTWPSTKLYLPPHVVAVIMLIFCFFLFVHNLRSLLLPVCLFVYLTISLVICFF